MENDRDASAFIHIEEIITQKVNGGTYWWCHKKISQWIYCWKRCIKASANQIKGNEG